MERTREEVARRALRLIGVCAADEPPTADAMEGALEVLDSLWAELCVEAQPTWSIVTGVPAEAFVPFAHWLGAELAGEYTTTAPMTRGAALLRLLSVVRTAECDDCREADPCADYGQCGTTIYLPRGGPFDEDVGPPVYSES